MKWLNVALLGCFLAAPVFGEPMDVNILQVSLQKSLDRERLENNVAAMQMTVILPSKEHLTFASGYIEYDENAPLINANTLFQIGSDTRSFTAALMIKLEMEGKLKLSDPLSKYFPQYPQWGKATIAQLLRNNSGVPNYSEDPGFQKKMTLHPRYEWEVQDLLAIAAKMPVKFEPGQSWHYSNTNYLLAGLIAEKVTKKSLKELYKEYFLGQDALDLSNTYYLPGIYPAKIMRQMAHGYVKSRDIKTRDVTYDNMSWSGAGGAMVSNSANLADWAYALFHDKIFPNDMTKKMISPISIKTGKVVPKATDGYGMGLRMRTSPQYGKWYGHEGETLGYHAIFIWFPKYDITAAILTNGEAPHLRDFAESLPGLIEQ